MRIDASPVSIVYCGPESSTWAGLLMMLCRQNPLFNLVKCASLSVAEINIAASSRAACLMVHGSFYQEAKQRGGDLLSARPSFFLVESGEKAQPHEDEVWIEPGLSFEAIASLIVGTVLRFLEHHPSDPADSREVVGRAAHDLKSPLAAILAYCHIALTSGKTGPRSRRFFSRIEANARQADDLIVRHMTGFMAAQGRLKVVPVPTCVTEWLNDELGYEIETITKKGLRFEVAVDERIPEQLTFDRLLLSQIMKNLLENASRHTESGAIKISAGYLPAARKLRLEVRDSGKGISIDNGQSVFQMFSECSDHSQRKFRSIGIGLSNARRLARLMGGDVTLVDTAPGRGTTFRVELESIPYDRGMELAKGPAEAVPD